MIVKDIRLIFDKLNSECTRALETAVGLCVTRGHYELTWEHMLLQLVEAESNDVACILRHFDIDAGRVKKAITGDLENVRDGNTGKPTFSPLLIAHFERAWSVATLYYGFERITSGVLMVAAAEEMKRSMAGYAAQLRAIDPVKLQNDLPAIIATSSEIDRPVEAGGKAAAAAPKGGEGNEFLQKYCRNLTEEARSGRIDPILGRDQEILQVIDIFSRRRKNNPILVGEAGVGKTAVVEGMAQRIASGDVPDNLKGVELWELDLGLLQAGAGIKGEFEKRLKGVIDAAKSSGGTIILFIDEAHTLIGAGGAAGSGDAANLLKPALARGGLRTCAATTWLEYRKYFEKDPALTRRFQVVKVDEPDVDTACIMLRGIADSYEKHHGVHITDAAIRAAAGLSERYISGRQLPDKAVDVLDTACTRVKMSRTTTPGVLDSARKRLFSAQQALAALNRDAGAGIAVSEDADAEQKLVIEQTEKTIAELSDKWEREKGVVDEIIDMRKRLHDQAADGGTADPALQDGIRQTTARLAEQQGTSPLVHATVSSQICAQVIGDWTGIPVGNMVKDTAQVLLELEDRLSRRVKGQDEAIAEISSTIRAAKSGMSDPGKPLGVFLFSGPSGVGKTECAMALAELLFGGERFSTVINMSEYQEKHTVSQLKGSPPGYVGYGEGGILTEAVRRKPYSIVILDEVEKAHRDVLNMFYQVFDKGLLRDGEGRDIDFKNTVIIMTSNLGSETILGMCEAGGRPAASDLIESIRPELTAHFQPALLARCKIVPFYPLGADILRSVIELKLGTIAHRLQQTHKARFTYSDKVVEAIGTQCNVSETGARNIDGIIDRRMLPAISRELLSRLGDEETTISGVSVDATGEGGFSATFEEEE